MDMVPVRKPVMLVSPGVKLTRTTQLALGGRGLTWNREAVLLRRVVASVKSEELANKLLKFKGVVPVFVTVIVCEALLVPWSWLPKVRLVGDMLTAGAPVAVPLTGTNCCKLFPFPSLSVKIRSAVLNPVTLLRTGEKVTPATQLADAGSGLT